jgi:hypothetical protein
MRKLQIGIRAAAVAASIVGFGWASGANATIVDLGNAPSPINISGISGIASMTYAPSPDTDTKYTTDGDTMTIFPNQSGSTIASGVQTLFGLSTTPTLGPDFSSVAAGGQTFSVPGGFNFVAIHQDTGEVVFEYATTQFSFTVQGFDGANGTGSGVMLSNTQFLSGAPAVPEPSTWAMMLLGLVGLGFAFRQSRRKVSFA